MRGKEIPTGLRVKGRVWEIRERDKRGENKGELRRKNTKGKTREGLAKGTRGRGSDSPT